MQCVYLCNKSRKGKYSTLVTEEVESLGGVITEFGLRNVMSLLRSEKLIHSYLGGWRLLVVLLFLGHKDLVVSLGGSDILGYRRRGAKYKFLGPIVIYLTKRLLFRSKAIIAVSEGIREKLSSNCTSKTHVIPKGVRANDIVFNINGTRPVDLVLIPDRENSDVKNFKLAQQVVANTSLNTVALCGMSREEVFKLFSQSKCLLIVSKHEGSPNVVKEALYMGCSVVSLDVGDVCQRTKSLPGCYISKSSNVGELRGLVEKSCAESFDRRILRSRVIQEGLMKDNIAARIHSVYEGI